MKEWKYLIGSADDFIGAPEWAALKTKCDSYEFFLEHERKGARYVSDACPLEVGFAPNNSPDNDEVIIAQRTESFGNAIDLEFCKANPDHPDCKCKGGFLNDAFVKAESEANAIAGAVLGKYKTYAINIDDRPSKYSRPCKGVTIDVYDVLQAFAVTNPATQHAIKKLLCAGLRGHKDKMQDLTEALKSIERAIELEKE